MNDLDRRLRALTDQVPGGRPDLERVIARGRTLRRRRLTVSAAIGIAAAVGAATVASALARDLAPGPFVDNPPRPPFSTETALPATEESSAGKAASEVAFQDVEAPLGLIDERGLHPNDMADEPMIEGTVTVAFADGEGGIIYQLADEPRSIRWRHADGTEEDPVTVEPGPTTLVGTVRWGGDLYVAFSAAVPDAEVPSVRLMLHPRPAPGSGELLTAHSTDLVVDGGIEGVALTPDGRLVVSACHVACTLHAVDLTVAATGQNDLRATEVPGEARMSWGLDGTSDGRLVTVVSEGPAPLGRAWLDIGPLQGGPATRVDLPIDDTTDGAWLQASSDGTAAVVELREGGETTRWLWVDRLDTGAPRVRTITGVQGRLVLLDDPPTGPS
jgi:hypothetical protein